MSTARPLQEAKVVLVGDSSVGKTSIVLQLYTSQFDENCEPTIGTSFVTKSIAGSNFEIQLHIWDTAGQERFKSVIPMYMRGSAAVLIVCAHDSIESVKSLDGWYRLASDNAPDALFYVVFNKSDLKCEFDELEPMQWADSHNFKFFKVTSKSNNEITAMFQYIAEDIANSHRNVTIHNPSVSLEKLKENDKKCC